MVTTFTVLAASMMLGQTPGAPAVQPAPKTYIYNGGVLVPMTEARVPAPSANPTDSSRPILSRIQSWFKRGDEAPPHVIGGNSAPRPVGKPIMPPADQPAPAVNFPRKLPSAQTSAPKSEVVVAQQKVAAEAPKTAVIGSASLTPSPTAQGPILPINVNRIGRDDKFEWVTGQLEIVKGQYVLYYATPDTVDAHHGRIPLAAQKVDMRQFRSGDLVSVRGQLSRGATPVYQLTSADLIDRPKR